MRTPVALTIAVALLATAALAQTPRSTPSPSPRSTATPTRPAAAPTTAPAPAATQRPAVDPEALKAKAQVCEACHGPQGNPVDPAIPALAGQPKQFITTQLVMYREGRRVHEVMSAIAKDMPNPDINDFGTYFSAQKRVVSAPELGADKIAAGLATAQRLNCVVCHGSALTGVQHVPRIAGQQADYLRAQLKGFKAGTRFDMDGNMTAAAQLMTPVDIDVLSEYLSSSHQVGSVASAATTRGSSASRIDEAAGATAG